MKGNQLFHDALVSFAERRVIVMKKIIIWGMGNNYQIVLDSIRRDSCEIIGVIDNRSNILKEIHKEINFIDKENLENIEFDCIIISSIDCGTIIQEIRKNNISEAKYSSFWNEDDRPDIINYDKKKIAVLQKQLADCKVLIENMPYEINCRKEEFKYPIILGMDALIDKLIDEKLSLCRFGDGELDVMLGKQRAWFQKYDERIKRRLLEIFNSENKNVVIAVADNFASLDQYTKHAAMGIRTYLANGHREELVEMIGTKRVFYNAYISRPYMIYEDKSNAKNVFDNIKRLWKNRNVLIVEGKSTRMGVNNTLLSECASVRRILCPDTEAFNSYETILEKVKENVNKGDLVLSVLGQTATILSYDLALCGVQAIDIGQIDNEYEWYLRGVQKRIPIPGKTVSEFCRGFIFENCELKDYYNQIVCEINNEEDD